MIDMLDLKLEYEYMKRDIDAAISRALEHQKWIFGPEVGELEEKIAGYTAVKNCVGTSSGTEALVIALRALSIKLTGKQFFDRSDEIITTPLTFTATGDAILRSGATPVFVDINPRDFNIDPDLLRKYLRSNKEKVKGIIPVHIYGMPCDMDAIMEIAEKYGLFVVEDVAQAFGGDFRGRKLGSIGDCGAFSFFPSKNLGGFGDGGMIATDDDELASLARMLIRHGGRDKYNVEHIGYNARLDTLQAAVLLAKFKYLDEFNGRRKAIAEKYGSMLKNVKGIALPLSPGDSGHVYHQYTIRVHDGKRSALQEYLKRSGISSMVYYPVPLHRMKMFEGRGKAAGSLAESEKASAQVLSLPIEPLIGDDQISFVAENIKKFFGEETA